MIRTLAAALTTSTCIVALATPAAAQTREYNIPAGSLKSALDAYVRQSGRQVVYRADQVRSARSPGTRGQQSAEAALAAILSGSGFTTRVDGNLVAIVREGNGPAVAETSASSRDGAADGIPAAGESAEIVVTGSRIRGAKPTSPVVSASREKITELGFTDLGSYVRSIPQNYNGGQNPGVVSGSQNGSENATSSSTLNLRGLGPDATLTLLNGHRVAYDAASQGIDISAIPLAAIERVELVADGASALYGSDAVGGVANIILRRDFEGVETSVRVGGATDGGAFQQQYSVITGHRWNSGGFMVAGDINKATGVSARQRSYTNGAVNPELTILPPSNRRSIVIAAHQSLGNVMAFGIDGHYNQHKSSFSLPNGSGTNIQSGATASPDIRSWSISPNITFHLPINWDVTARATRGISDSGIKVEAFSGGSRLFVNDVKYRNDLWAAELSAEGPIFTLPGGVARAAVGGGLRSNSLRVLIQRTTPTALLTIQNYTDSQSATFAFGEVSLPLIGGNSAMPLIHSLQVTGAVRYESYERIGELATPKLGVSYQPLSDLTLKGTWGKSFKAPTLYQSNVAPQGTLYAPTRYLPAPPTNENVLQISGRRRPLEPEKASTLTLTAEVKPSSIPRLKLEASFFDVRYNNRVTNPIASSSQAFRSEYADLIILNPTLEQVLAATTPLSLPVQNLSGTAYDPANLAAIVYTGYQNVARQHIQGVDGSVAYGFSKGNNEFSLEANASYIESDQQLSAGQAVVEQAGSIFRPPHWRGSANGTWKRGAVTTTISYNYLGGTEDRRTSTTYKVSAFHSIDATIGWKPEADGFWAGWSFLLASQNIFNRKPSLIQTTSVALPNYDATNYPAIGRTISFTLSKAW